MNHLNPAAFVNPGLTVRPQCVIRPMAGLVQGHQMMRPIGIPSALGMQGMQAHYNPALAQLNPQMVVMDQQTLLQHQQLLQQQHQQQQLVAMNPALNQVLANQVMVRI